MKGKKLYVVHNLPNFIKVKQVEKYINKTLLKCFLNLREAKMVKLDSLEATDNRKINRNNTYLTEILENGDKYNYEVHHFIMAYEGSEAGDFYSISTINFLRIQL